ncbi:40S ribosomal protein S15-4 [Tanacetum coccineum]
MEGQEPDVAVAKKRTFKKFSFRGVDLDALLDMSTDELVKMFTARARRRFQRGLKRKPMALIKKLRKADALPLEEHDHCSRNDGALLVFTMPVKHGWTRLLELPFFTVYPLKLRAVIDGHKGDFVWVVSNLLQGGRNFLDDFLVSALGVLGGGNGSDHP